MTLPDVINGLFELIAGLFIWLNVYRLYQDKIVKGVAWQATIFFMFWGYYNLYFYPHLDQWVSFAGGIMITVANTVWIYLYWRYRHNG